MHLLILSTYPMSAEASGGVVRLSAMRDAMAREGFSPVVVAVVPQGRRAVTQAECVVPLPLDAFSAADWAAPGFHDVATGLAAARSSAVIDEVAEHAERIGAQALVLEQPFLIDLLR